MPGTNFALAPPVRDVDGLHAVPIDIQHITAKFSFDGATHSSTGDATLQFTMGPDNGCPIFDLRQTITGVWLDGAVVPLGLVAHHDFGGGLQAQLLVIAQTLVAGSTHALRVTYNLGIPQASTAGSYQPSLNWSAGPRLQFNFGFTDLGPGRYLDAWVPANLIFDQFDLTLELQISNTGIAHTLITNGAVTPLGLNHWTVNFPSSSTALSTLIELHASDAVTGQMSAVVLPGGASVTMEVWKPAASTIDLSAEISALSGFLSTNVTAIGPYRFGNRFVVYFAGGGMEYDGGTTTSGGSLRHETHHSWWGRGVKPSSQADGWLDEAWTVYVTADMTPLAFSASDPPVELHSQNPWVRATPINAYSSGARLFQGIASLAGDSQLRTAMASFYQKQPNRPFTTIEMEGHLLSQLGRVELVDAFHRWVYGFSNAAVPPDLWMRDDPGHAGTESWGGRFWDSPDLWIRNADDGGTTHQDPITGRDNWFYARVRNRGTSAAHHFMVTFTVKEFAGTEFVYSADFLPAMAASGGFELAPGGSVVIKARWPAALVPAAGMHGCLLASVHAQGNHPVVGRHVWEENAIAQKNLTIVNLVPGGFVIIPVMIGHWVLQAQSAVLELRRPPEFPKLAASLLLPPPHLVPPNDLQPQFDCGGGAPTARHAGIVTSDMGSIPDRHALAGLKETPLPPGQAVRWKVESASGFPLRIGLRLELPTTLAPGKSVLVDLAQLDANLRPVGGIAVMLTAKG